MRFEYQNKNYIILSAKKLNFSNVDYTQVIQEAPGGFCNSIIDMCFISRSINRDFCSGKLAPSGIWDERYNIKEHAKLMNEMRFLIKVSLNDVEGEVVRYGFFSLVMFPNSIYDFKSNEPSTIFFTGTQDAGNYNYGYLGSALGIPESHLLQASGLIQFLQNPFKYDFQEVLSSVINKNFIPLDNSDDPETIQNGIDAYFSGCESITNSSLTNVGTSIYNGSGFFGRSFGGTRCIGKCEIPTGRVTITDL